MPSSNVRNVDSLDAFRLGLIQFSNDGIGLVHQLRALTHRAQQHFAEDRPAYWRAQLRIAERDFNEAKDNLARKRSAVRATDRTPATEAAQRVRRAERRIRLCMEKERRSRAVAIEIAQHCDKILGPLAEVGEQCEVAMPTAARELEQIIEQLRDYLDQLPPDT